MTTTAQPINHPAFAGGRGPVAINQGFAGRTPPVDRGTRVWGADGFTFEDVLDTINPLHHLPVVSAVYRHISGDQIAPGPRLLGAALFGGGPIGAAIGVAGAAVDLQVEQATGRDIGGHVTALLDGDTDPPTETAANEIAGLPWLDEPVAAARPAIDGLPWLAAKAAQAAPDLPARAGPPRWLAATPAPVGVAPLPPKIAPDLLVAEQTAEPAPARRASAPQLPHQSIAPGTGPVDISEAMSAALDKYARMSGQPAPDPKGRPDHAF